jgi:hypothetical protein
VLLRRAIHRQPGGAPALAADPHPDADADFHTDLNRQPHPLANHHAHPFQHAQDAHRNSDQDPYSHVDSDRHPNTYPIALANRNLAALGDLYQHAGAADIHKYIGATYLHKYAHTTYFNQHACNRIGHTRSPHRYPQSFCDFSHTDRPIRVGQFANSWSTLA